jgi:hypothetical protein
MTLTLEEGINLQKAVNSLQTYRFSAGTTKKIAVNCAALLKAFPDYDAKRAEILRETGNPPETDPGFKMVVAAFDKWVRETPIEVEFTLIRYEDLNIGESEKLNHIPPIVVSHLLPMVNTSEGQ